MALAITMGACSSTTTTSTPDQSPTPTVPPRTAPAPPVQPTDPCPGAINWTQASAHIGNTVTIKGPVKSVNYEPSETGQPTFLNVGRDYPNNNRVAVVIWGKNRFKFSPKPENAYSLETICVTAPVGTFQGVPQMTVTKPSQISVA